VAIINITAAAAENTVHINILSANSRENVEIVHSAGLIGIVTSGVP
jgi:2-methylaconitate cis-trans-isomerase PrpF